MKTAAFISLILCILFACSVCQGNTTNFKVQHLPSKSLISRHVASLHFAATDVSVVWAEKQYAPVNVNTGDNVRFEWSGQHGVDAVPSGDCPTQFRNNPQVKTIAAVSNGGTFTWKASSPGTFYFACPVSDHCAEGGQIIEIVVS